MIFGRGRAVFVGGDETEVVDDSGLEIVEMDFDGVVFGQFCAGAGDFDFGGGNFGAVVGGGAVFEVVGGGEALGVDLGGEVGGGLGQVGGAETVDGRCLGGFEVLVVADGGADRVVADEGEVVGVAGGETGDLASTVWEPEAEPKSSSSVAWP